MLSAKLFKLQSILRLICPSKYLHSFCLIIPTIRFRYMRKFALSCIQYSSCYFCIRSPYCCRRYNFNLSSGTLNCNNSNIWVVMTKWMTIATRYGLILVVEQWLSSHTHPISIAAFSTFCLLRRSKYLVKSSCYSFSRLSNCICESLDSINKC
jgi:hypothetical protein